MTHVWDFLVAGFIYGLGVGAGIGVVFVVVWTVSDGASALSRSVRARRAARVLRANDAVQADPDVDR
jgi:hypothetical protein